ncbi:MAG: BREX-2 system adenine-specific DNA-methyltransferase PglX [Proteobacteria bacterium]|nr:BREX-2 system adenine-specific DNA-methyltransferase PglX [Pseudomonadota bacterium]
MQASERARLTTALRSHVTRIAADLRDKLRRTANAPDQARERALALHRDEGIGDDFEVWTDVLSRRAAVLWVLKSVYVRVLEDRGLLAPGRLVDPEAQELFERLAPNLGDTAFLRWVYRDLAKAEGGLPELFTAQPAEVAAPDDALSRDLIAFWRHRDPDTGATWSFAHERFEGELMGDLYQELDPVVKDRFALCQTPDFVRAFMLDRTLTPAIATFGADTVRVIDPACGSGHFLIDALKRLMAATAAQHPGWDRGHLVTHCLDRVVGIDLNDYACALARARLLMTAADLAGVTDLADTARFHPHVYWADGLDQVERDADLRGQQLDLLDASRNQPVPGASLTRPEVRVALRAVLDGGFHAVVANPPYITEKDKARKAYHTERIGRRRRYISASRKYSLSSPFTERCFQLAVPSGFVGLIASNNFMKREFGRPLIEQVLPKLDLTLVVDTSQAYIPFHGTPTVLLFGRHRPPSETTVRTVMGKRGETGTPAEPAKGRVWTSIVDGWDRVGFENEFVSVIDVPRTMLDEHPWNLAGGGAIELKERVSRSAEVELGKLVESIGFMAITGEDEAFVAKPDFFARHDLPNCGFGVGEDVRDWRVTPRQAVLFPYSDDWQPESTAAVLGWLWRFRTLLRRRLMFGKTQEQAGLTWFEYRHVGKDKTASALSIAFAFVATHNHFVLDRGGKVFNRSAPVIKLPAEATEDDHLALLGLLNSSTACFWMKQVFHPKGTTSANRNHPDPERFAYEFATTGLSQLPIPEVGVYRTELIDLTRRLDRLAMERARLVSHEVWSDSLSDANALRDKLKQRWKDHDDVRQQMVYAQEELDWLAYYLYGLTKTWIRCPQGHSNRLSRGQRAFERVKGHRSFVRDKGQLVDTVEAECETGSRALPDEYLETTAQREQEIRNSEHLALIDAYLYKRLWRDTEENVREADYRKQYDKTQLRQWLLERIEANVAAKPKPFALMHLSAVLMDDASFHTVATVYASSAGFSIEKMLREFFDKESVPHHPFHIYTDSGLTKRAAWEATWASQRREDAGEKIEDIPVPPTYSQGSRGKSTDFLRGEYWKLRGKLDVPKERFIAFTEVPGRAPADTLYGWAGWTPLQRVRALLAMDEDLEDAGLPIADRIGVLDSAWRLLPDVTREDPTAARRLRAELQALVGTDGPSREMLEDWKRRFPPAKKRPAKTGAGTSRATKTRAKNKNAAKKRATKQSAAKTRAAKTNSANTGPSGRRKTSP